MIVLSIPFQKDIEIPDDYSGWKEYRLDYNSNPESFEKKLVDEQTIITIRDPQEGGINPFPIKKKIDLYINYIKDRNCLVDLELENHKFAKNLPAQNTLLSWHYFSENWDCDLIKQKIEKAISLKPRLVKIALKISLYTQFIQIAEILKSYNYPIIFVGMGLLGKQSRLLYNQLNSRATYIGLNEIPTASGQLTLSEAEQYNLFELNSETKIGGLIGGEQVYHSLGLKFYNDYFKRNSLNAIYLPLPVTQLKDFIKWQNTFSHSDYGYSITMPFKTEMSKMIKADEQNINLYLPKQKRSFNTDKIALQKAIAYLKMKQNDKILIYGSGATAEMALQVLESYSNIFLESRNSETKDQQQIRYERLGHKRANFYDLIINCTPMGMKGEDFLKSTGLSVATKYIDLPYSAKQTPLSEFCLANNIDFVDGKMFWEWQADKQLAEFSEALQE